MDGVPALRKLKEKLAADLWVNVVVCVVLDESCSLVSVLISKL
jgi:hypothetical protein